MRQIIRGLSLLLSFSLVACVGVATESARPGNGVKFEKSGLSYDQVWDAANRSIARTYPIANTNKVEGRIVTERTTGSSYWREMVTVFIKPVDKKPNTYSVEVVSHNKMKNKMTPENFEIIVLESVKAELDLINNRDAIKKKLGIL